MEPKFLATAIGSMPFTDPEYAVQVSLSRLKDAPSWPQLPQLGLKERMEIQYGEGMPRAVVDYAKSRLCFDTSGNCSETLAKFYETYMVSFDEEKGAENDSAFAIGENFSKGIYAFENALKKRSAKLPFIKVQTTGPFSLALTAVDENERPIYYNNTYKDVIVKALAMKCRWQIRKFRPYAEQMICFVDEPILSAHSCIMRDDVVAALGNVLSAVHAEEALAGVHCCGDTDWGMLIDTGADILSFDAFNYGHTTALYAGPIKKHLERGGVLAWGIVPTSQIIREQTVETLEIKFETVIDALATAGGISKSLITKQAMITPACGTGLLCTVDAERVFKLLEALSARMRVKYGFGGFPK